MKEQASIASDLLVKCHEHLICHTGEVTFDYLQAVAQCRIGLLIAGECLHESGHVQINASLLNSVKSICTNKRINRISPTEATGPNIFLLKVLARSRNMSALKQVAQKHTWLLWILNMIEVLNVLGITTAFMYYCRPFPPLPLPVYALCRDLLHVPLSLTSLFITRVMYFLPQDLEVHERIFIILALYEVVTLNHIQRKHQRLAGPPGQEVDESSFFLIFLFDMIAQQVVLAFEKCKVLPTKVRFTLMVFV